MVNTKWKQGVLIQGENVSRTEIFKDYMRTVKTLSHTSTPYDTVL